MGAAVGEIVVEAVGEGVVKVVVATVGEEVATIVVPVVVEVVGTGANSRAAKPRIRIILDSWCLPATVIDTRILGRGKSLS